MVIAAIVSYLIGSIPFAVLVSRFFKLGDITKFGSGNPGATNMVRLGGKKLGVLTFALDAAKGAVAVALFSSQIAFLAVILGHCFSVFLKFKGGKGVATFLGALLIFNFYAAILCAAIWCVVFLLFRISAVSALSAINITAIVSGFLWPESFVGLAAAAILISYRHKQNITDLLSRRS